MYKIVEGVQRTSLRHTRTEELTERKRIVVRRTGRVEVDSVHLDPNSGLRRGSVGTPVPVH